MAKVKLLSTMINLYNYVQPGDVLDIKDEIAEVWIEQGLAEKVSKKAGKEPEKSGSDE